ncbi:RNA polymerase subunit sigma-70, partial [Tamilnaduibacter salinus]
MTDLAWTEPAPAVSGLDTTGETPIPWSAKASKDTETPSLVTRYFTEASRHPVLGERAERKLGRQLARALASLRIALGHPDNTALTLRDVIGNRREEELDSRRLRRCFRIAEACRQRLIQSNLRLAVHIARRHNGRHLPLTDLIQEANIGLIKAVERFDPERGFRFTTYAYWWVSEEVKRSLKRGPGVVRTPENMVDDLRALNAVQQRLSSELGRAPEANALA